MEYNEIKDYTFAFEKNVQWVRLGQTLDGKKGGPLAVLWIKRIYYKRLSLTYVGSMITTL